MSVSTALRLGFMLILALLGWRLGAWLAGVSNLSIDSIGLGYYKLVISLVGASVGFTFGPRWVSRPFAGLRDAIQKASVRKMVMGVLGLTSGLVVATLLTLPLSMLPGAWGQFLPLLAAVMLGGLGAAVMITRDREILALTELFANREVFRRKGSLVLLDTSVIIDGRVADISQSGFISGTMIVPRFVLDELQHIADSADLLRRNRGRRGLEILNKMQQDARIELEISDMDLPDTREVDSKLVELARKLDCPILTNDYNLNRVAELQGVQVLNINELANAVKAIVLPGETLRVHIIQEGKEMGQGVGYLDDGTMVVVEDGRRYINSNIEVAVTRVLQTVAGRMIFGQPQMANGRK